MLCELVHLPIAVTINIAVKQLDISLVAYAVCDLQATTTSTSQYLVQVPREAF